MRPHARLTTHWCIDAIVVVTLIVVWDQITLRILLLAIAVPYGVYEANWLKEVYRIAPTPKQFVSERPYWKTLGLMYGFTLSALALAMLTVGEGFSRLVGEHPAVFFGALIAPFAVFLAAHQLTVFQALRNREV